MSEARKQKSEFDRLLDQIVGTPNVKRIDAEYFYCGKKLPVVIYRMGAMIRIDIKSIS